MSKIALIATNEIMYSQGLSFKNRQENYGNLDVYMGSMDGAVKIAKSLSKEEVDVIICRGDSGTMVRNSGIEIPVVDMTLSDIEVVEAIEAAKKRISVENPRIAYVGYLNTYQNIKAFLHAMNINHIHFNIKSEQDTESALISLIGKVDIVIGGRSTCIIARKVGIPNVQLGASMKQLEGAYYKAREMQSAIHMEKKIAEERNTIINSVIEGIINIDVNRKITFVNTKASRMFVCDDLVNKSIFEVCTDLDADFVDRVFETGEPRSGYVLTVGEKKYVVAFNPVIVKKCVEGAILSLQEINEFQKTETIVRKNLYLKGNVAHYQFSDIKGISEELKSTIKAAKKFANVESNILIVGATGTGKELFAQSIHNISKRAEGPFVAVNCGAIPSNLIESELFGYTEGAFSGAKKGGKMGLFELAHKGTIFLDEISEMDAYGQVMLLRVLQERQIRRVGGDAVIPIDVRVIAACNVDLYDMVNKDLFRKDLFYRLSVLVLNIPDLSKRIGDVAQLTNYFVEKYNKLFDKQVVLLETAMQAMEQFEWKGNIRQLTNFCERIVAIAEVDELDGDFIRRELINSFFFMNKDKTSLLLEENERQQEEAVVFINGKLYGKEDIKRLLKEEKGNKTAVSRRLNLGRTSFWRIVKKLKLDD